MTIEEKVFQIIIKELPDFKRELRFVDQGMESITFIKILAAIEDEFGIRFPEESLFFGAGISELEVRDGFENKVFDSFVSIVKKECEIQS